MSLPEKLYFFGEEIEVRRCSKKVLKDRHGDYGDGEIRILDTLKGDLMWSVFVHEILHVCWRHANGEDMDVIEENLVERLEIPLYVMLKSNFEFGEGS